MNIVKENIDELNAVVKLKIEEDDYKQEVESKLRDYRRKATMKGFRPGKVPMGMIRKMYGKQVLLEEINKIVSQKLTSYIKDEGIKILGEPLASEKEQKPVDFDKDTEFEFAFDIGLAPEFDIDFNEIGEFPWYELSPSKKMIEQGEENYAKKYGENKDVEEIKGTEIVRGDFAELDENGKVKTDGISKINAALSVEVIKDQEIKNKFIEAQLNDTIIFNPRKAFPNDTDVSSMLDVQKDVIESLNAEFEFTITEIKRFIPAEINQQLFDKVYQEGTISTQEEFRNKIAEEIKIDLETQSDYKFLYDAKDLLIEKSGFAIPGDFLKRWLLRTNEKVSREQIEKEFDDIKKEFKWQLIKNKIAEDNNLEISEEDTTQEAKKIAKAQLAQYGMTQEMPDEQLLMFVQNLLDNEEQKKRIQDQAFEKKILDVLKDKTEKNIIKQTYDEFEEMINEQNKKEEEKKKQAQDKENQEEGNKEDNQKEPESTQNDDTGGEEDNEITEK